MTIKLFCLPYAGGSATIYYKYNRFLDGDIKLRPIELAGRGRRIKQPLYDNLEIAVDDIYCKIKSEIDEMPYAILGHSLGTLITYKLILKIQSEEKKPPLHTFLSAGRAPHMIGKVKAIHELPDSEFKKEIMKMGGTDIEVFNNPELSAFFIKLLKSDFKMIETYKYTPDYQKIDSDVSLFLGRDDRIDQNDILQWSKYTDKSCKTYEFNGDHFFINSQAEEVAKVINHTLLKEE